MCADGRAGNTTLNTIRAVDTVLNGEMVYARWGDVNDAAGLPTQDAPPCYHLHDFRHAAASLPTERNLSPMCESNVMTGHVNVTTTLGSGGHPFPSKPTIARAADEGAQALAATIR